MKKILFIYEKNQKIGNGHYVRIKRLYDYLKSHFKSKLIDLNSLNKNIRYQNDICILDLFDYKKKKIKNLRKKFKKIISFENFTSNFADLNISIFEHNSKLKGLKNRYHGLKYFFMNNLKIKKIKKNNNIFISIGSSLSLNKINRVKKIIRDNQDLKFILAPNFLGKINQKKNINISDKKNYFYNFKASKICITNAGNSLLEGIYFNKPCFVLPQTKKEEKFAKYLLEKKLIVDINNFNNARNKTLIKRVKHNTINIIDNKGAIRILKLVKKLFYDKNF